MPAAAVPIIAGVAAGAAAATVVTVSTAIAIGMAVASAVMMLSVKTPSLGDYKSASERGQVLRNAAAAKTLCYGRVVSSGLMVFVEEQPGKQEEGEWLHMLLLIAGHPIERIGTVYVGERTAAEYGGLVSYELINDPASANPHLLANCPSWKSDMIGRGMASFRISLKSDFEKFPSGLPNIRVEKFGSRVYDPRDGKTKWSANAALCILDYYRTWLHIPDDEINFDEFKVAANICDEIVSNGDGSTELRYQVHGEFDLTEPRAKVLEAMHMACAGQPTYVGGRHGLIVGAYYGPATDELHDHQIIDDLELLPEPPTQDKINTITGTFVDASAFKEADFPAVSVAQWIEEDGGQELAEDITLRCVTSPWQAQRLANIMLRQRRTSRTITCSVNLSGWRYRPGSYLRLYIPALGISGVEFRVVDWSFNLTGGVSLTLREESAAVWADAIGKPMERTNITNLPSGGVAAPDNLRYEIDQIEDVVQGVLLWSNSSQTVYNQVVIQAIADGKATTVHTAQCPGQRCRLAGLPAGSYVALVRAVAANGAHSPSAAVNFTIEHPVAPTGYEVEAGNWSLAIRPQYAGGAHVSVLCEWWWAKTPLATDAVQASATYAGIASYMTLQGLQPDTEYFWWGRAINAYGRSELVAGQHRTSYDPASILDILDGQIGADNLRPALREPIEKIPGIITDIDDVNSSVRDVNASVSEIAADVELIEIDLAATSAAVVDTSREIAAIGDALRELDDREKSVNDLLQSAQNQLGENYINVTLIQEMLRKRIDQYKGDFEDFRDAVFAVDPETGEITMDAVNAVRSELGAEITAVSQHLSAVEAIVNTCVTRAELSEDLERITVIEQDIDGIKGTLRQTATKSEMDALGSKVTQVEQGLDATNAALTQKAAQSAVDAQGQRLAAAEQKISANASATESSAQRIEQVNAELQLADQATSAAITELSETVASEDAALSRRIDNVRAELVSGDQAVAASVTALSEAVATETEALARRLTGVDAQLDGHAASIHDLQEVITGDGQSIAGRFENIKAEVDLTAESAIADALATAAENIRQRLASGQIRRDQQVIVDAHQALARVVEEINASYQSADADLDARVASVREALTTETEALARLLSQLEAAYLASDAELAAGVIDVREALANETQALARLLTQLQADYQAADSALAASVSDVREALSTETEALARALTQLTADYRAADDAAAQATSAAIQSEQTARADADAALGKRVDTVQATAAGNTAAIQSEQTARADADEALGKRVDTVQAAAAGNTAAIQSEQTARADADEALSLRVDTVQATADDNTAAIQSEQTARAAADEAMARQTEQIRAELDAADQVISAAITSLSEAVVTENAALASRIDGVSVEIGDNSAAIKSLQEAFSSETESSAGRTDNLEASIALASEAAIADALSGASEGIRLRHATGSIRRRQEVIADEQQALAREIEVIRADYQATDADLGASITSVREALASETEALASLITQLRAEYKAADDAAAQAVAAAIQTEQTARAAADEALGRRVDTVQATAAGNTSAIQTVAQATANISGQVEAGWYTKAQINGAGGGFGLSVQLNSDGSTLTSFVVDADVFAVLSRATGVTSPRHPFVVKNGTVYLNHALMETAEITNLIASAIKTVTLSAVTIDNSVFKGGAAAFGRGGPNVAFGETWHTTISSDGTIATNRLVASAGEFSGTIKANAGEMSNVTIREDCEVMGTVYADRIVGDIVRVYALGAGTTHDLGSAKFLRTLVISGVANSTVSASASLSVALNGSSVFAVGASPSTQRTVLASQTVWSNGNISIPSHSHSTPSGYTGSTSIYGVSGSSHSHSISGSSTGSSGGYSSSISVSGSTNPMSVEVDIATSASNIAAVTLHAGVNYTLVTSASIGSGTSATAIGIVCKG